MTRDHEAAAAIDDVCGEQGTFGTAFRKFANLVDGTNENPGVQVLEATFRALDEVDALRERVDELEAQNTALEHRLEKLATSTNRRRARIRRLSPSPPTPITRDVTDRVA